MCYFIDNSKINVDNDIELSNALSNYVIAPEYPQVPIITDQSEYLILAKWRFNPALPDLPKTRSIGLNIKSENASVTPMFKDFNFNHCIIPINGFYEWKHFENHKIKVKHYITMDDEETFYLAGLWRFYDGNKVSFGVLTTKANDLMADIHNSKFRMPICLNSTQANEFLKLENLADFEFPHLNPKLSAVNLEPQKIPNTLF